MDGTTAPLGSWDEIIKDEQYGNHKLIDMDNRRITRAKCWMKQVFCTKCCLSGKLPCTKISPGLDGWRTYRDVAGLDIVPEKKSGSPTSVFVEGIRVERQQKESEKGNVGDIDDDESSTNDEIKAIRSFKFVLVEHIRYLLKPYWKQGNLSRDADKVIMKKSVDKIIERIGASKVPKTENEQHIYISTSKTKIFVFIQIIMKKSMDKIIESIGASKVPKTENEQYRYISTSKTKIFEFIQIIMKKSVDKIIEIIGASKVPKTENEQHRYISTSKTKIFEFIQG